MLELRRVGRAAIAEQGAQIGDQGDRGWSGERREGMGKVNF